jgi:hypothetical protein
VLKKGHLTVQGYWQSPLYFQNSAENIRQFLKESLPLNVLGDYAVIHIRRGDFFNDPKTLAYHGLITLGYYKAATQIIPSSAEKFLIISDDLDEATKIRKVLKQLFETRDFEIFANSNSEIEVLSLSLPLRTKDLQNIPVDEPTFMTTIIISVFSCLSIVKLPLA